MLKKYIIVLYILFFNYLNASISVVPSIPPLPNETILEIVNKAGSVKEKIKLIIKLKLTNKAFNQAFNNLNTQRYILLNILNQPGNFLDHLDMALEVKKLFIKALHDTSTQKEILKLFTSYAQKIGRNPFRLAAANSFYLTTLFLKEPSLNPNGQSLTSGKTALHLAAENNQPNIVKLLLRDARVKPNIKDNFGHTPIDVARIHIQKILMSNPHVIYKPETIIIDIFNHPLYSSNKKLMHILDLVDSSSKIKKYFTQNAPDLLTRLINLKEVNLRVLFDGLNALSKAIPTLLDTVENNEILKARILLKFRQDFALNRNPLRYAAAIGNPFLVSLLLSQPGLQVNARGSGRRTALHHAANNGYLKIVKMLVSAGANPLIKDEKGKTPSDLAKQNSYTEIVRYLKKQ